MNLETFDETGFVNLFDGYTLDGWHMEPRVYGALYPGGPGIETLLAKYGITPPLEPARDGSPLPDLPRALSIVADVGYASNVSIAPGRGGPVIDDIICWWLGLGRK